MFKETIRPLGKNATAILFVNKFFFLNGGSETVFFQERDYLKHLSDYQVVDFSMEHEKNIESDYSGYFIQNVSFEGPTSSGEKLASAIKFIHNREAVSKIEEIIRKEKPKIAHLHNIYHQITPAIIPVLKRAGVKVILTMHDYKLICPAYTMLRDGAICDRCEGKHFYKALSNRCREGSTFKSALLTAEAYYHKFKKSYDYVDLFISPSQFLAEIISKRVGAKKIRVLKNGIDVSQCEATFQDDGYALYFGRLSREKGILTLLAAYQKSSRSLPLKIVGDGEMLEELKPKYPDVDFTGYLSGEKLASVIGSSSFVVVPSEWNENCSMAVLEAMAYGKAIIGSDVGGIPEQVEDGKTGLLFEMGNEDELAEKIETLFENRDMRNRMGRAAREKVSREYALEEHNSNLVKLYEEVLSPEECLPGIGRYTE